MYAIYIREMPPKECPPGKIVNPNSGRCVKIDGRIGKLLQPAKGNHNSKRPSSTVSHSVLRKMAAREALLKLKDSGNKKFTVYDPMEVPERFQPFWSLNKGAIVFGKQISFTGKFEKHEYIGAFTYNMATFTLFILCGKECVRLVVKLPSKKVTCSVLTPNDTNDCDPAKVSMDVCNDIFETLQFSQVDSLMDMVKSVKLTETTQYFVPKAFKRATFNLPKAKFDSEEGVYTLVFKDGYIVSVSMDARYASGVLVNFEPMVSIETKTMELSLKNKHIGVIELNRHVEDIAEKVNEYWDIAWNVGTQFLQEAVDFDKYIQSGSPDEKKITYDLEKFDITLPKNPLFYVN
jgi:hypothetical protein